MRLSAGLLGVLVAVALLAPSVAPYDPRHSTGRPLERPSLAHPLGTNDIGQDLFSQLLHATRSTLAVAGAAAGIAGAIAWLVGLLTTWHRRLGGALLMLTDVVWALPDLPIYLFVLAWVGADNATIILLLGVTLWAPYARIVRAHLLAVRAAGYVEAAVGLGATAGHVLRRHMLPATLGILPPTLALLVRSAVFAEATLAFLGAGDPTTPTWGRMLGWAFAYPLLFATGAWQWWVLPPALGIAAVILAVTWLGRSLEPWHAEGRARTKDAGHSRS